MKTLLFVALFFPFCLLAQQPIISLYSPNYIAMDWAKPETKVNSPIIFTYRRDYTLIIVDNKSIYFHNILYRQDAEGNEIVERINLHCLF
jgi:hypothetical protein